MPSRVQLAAAGTCSSPLRQQQRSALAKLHPQLGRQPQRQPTRSCPSGQNACRTAGRTARPLSLLQAGEAMERQAQKLTARRSQCGFMLADFAK